MKKILNYINGELIEPISKTYIDNINPATGEVYSLISDSDEKDVELAVTAAAAAFLEWSNMPVSKRSDILLKISSLIDKNLDQLALAEALTRENLCGFPKPLIFHGRATTFIFMQQVLSI